MNSVAEPNTPLLSIAPGPLHVFESSASLHWQGVLVEKHHCSPGERVSMSTGLHVVSLLVAHPSRFEYFHTSGRPVFQTNSAGAITITPAGPIPDVRLHTEAEWIHCAFEDSFIRRLVAGMEGRPAFTPIFRAEIRDPSIQRLVTLLFEELDAKAPSGILYVDSLAHALATRLLRIEGGCDASAESRVSPLPTRALNRVRQKMEANLDSNLSLDCLAEETGYSREHFLRMFHAATGFTPHQYILDLRLSQAKQWLKRKTPSLIDIAASCGFSSQSHMTNVFRKRLGITPAEFRRAQ